MSYFNKLFYFILLLSATLTLASCETDDVPPDPNADTVKVTLASNSTSITEDGGLAIVTATLSEASDALITIDLDITGTAEGSGVDYALSENFITIPAGDLTGTVEITAVQDKLEEGNETVELRISNVTGGITESEQQVSIIIEDDDVPFVAQIIVNEILYDPSNNELDGDANGDGVYAQNEDEFIEFINLSAQSADLSGFKIYDSEALTEGSPRHTFPANSIVPPGGVIVVFGGGTPTGSFGGAIVQTSTSDDMNLNNAGDVMTLTDTEGNVVVTFDIEPYSDNPNESYTRNPDITGEFEQHGSITEVLFSPGTKSDGSPF